MHQSRSFELPNHLPGCIPASSDMLGNCLKYSAQSVNLLSLQRSNVCCFAPRQSQPEHSRPAPDCLRNLLGTRISEHSPLIQPWIPSYLRPSFSDETLPPCSPLSRVWGPLLQGVVPSGVYRLVDPLHPFQTAALCVAWEAPYFKDWWPQVGACFSDCPYLFVFLRTGVWRSWFGGLLLDRGDTFRALL